MTTPETPALGHGDEGQPAGAVGEAPEAGPDGVVQQAGDGGAIVVEQRADHGVHEHECTAGPRVAGRPATPAQTRAGRPQRDLRDHGPVVGRQASAGARVVDVRAEHVPASVGEHVVDARAVGRAVPLVVGRGLRPALAQVGERVAQAADDQSRDGRVAGRRVEVAHDQPRQRWVEPAEQRLRAAPARGCRGAVPVGVGDAEALAGPPVREPAEGDDAGDRVAPGARARPARRVREPVHRPRVQAQSRRPVDDRAALAAAVAVVATGAGAGVAGQPARQTPFLKGADLLQPDEVRLEAADRRRAGSGAQRPAVPPVAAEPGPYVEGGDAQETGRPRPSVSRRAAFSALTHVGK